MGAVGWFGIRGADGTTMCWRSAKKPVKARRSSLAFIPRTSLRPAGRRLRRPRLPEVGLELVLPVPHGDPALGQRRAHILAEAAHRRRDPFGPVPLDGDTEVAHEPERQPE